MYLNRYPLRPEPPPRDEFAPKSVRYDRAAKQFVVPYLGRRPHGRALIIAILASVALAALFVAFLWGRG